MPNWKKLITSGSDALLSNITVDNSIQGSSITGSIDFNNLTNSPTLISGSSQVSLLQTTGFSDFSSSIDSHLDANISTVNNTVTSISSSLDSRINTEKGRIDAILLSADADKDSFAEIVSLINSVDTTNDQAFAAFYTSSTGRLGALEAYTASLNSNTLVSGSSQIDISQTTGYSTFSASIDTHLDNVITSTSSSIASDIADLSVFSSSLQTTLLTLSGSFSGSFIGDGSQLSGVTSYTDADTLSYINSLGVVSSSLQINSGSFSGSFQGDGSGLTGVQTSVVETTTVVDAFSNKLTISVPHNFGTKNVIAHVYDSTDNLIIPESLVTTNINQIDITFAQSTSGRVVVAKGGHLVSGSIELFTVRENVSGSSSYTINHNLNEDFPIVQVYDTAKKQVIPQDIESVNANSVTVDFLSNFNGTIVIKK